MSSKKNYPENLLSLIGLNEICGTEIDYGTLTDDQMKGLDALLGQVTERECAS